MLSFVRLRSSSASAFPYFLAEPSIRLLTSTMSLGDHTIEGLEQAIDAVGSEEADDHFVIALTDANFDRKSPFRCSRCRRPDPNRLISLSRLLHRNRRPPKSTRPQPEGDSMFNCVGRWSRGRASTSSAPGQGLSSQGDERPRTNDQERTREDGGSYSIERMVCRENLLLQNYFVVNYHRLLFKL